MIDLSNGLANEPHTKHIKPAIQTEGPLNRSKIPLRQEIGRSTHRIEMVEAACVESNRAVRKATHEIELIRDIVDDKSALSSRTPSTRW